jgi:hypothetical protein
MAKPEKNGYTKQWLYKNVPAVTNAHANNLLGGTHRHTYSKMISQASFYFLFQNIGIRKKICLLVLCLTCFRSTLKEFRDNEMEWN